MSQYYQSPPGPQYHVWNQHDQAVTVPQDVQVCEDSADSRFVHWRYEVDNVVAPAPSYAQGMHELPNTEACDHQHQAHLHCDSFCGRSAYSQTLSDASARLCALPPIITEDLDRNWVFEDEIDTFSKPDSNPDSRFYYNANHDVDYAYHPPTEVACVYYNGSELLTGPSHFISNLHYPYGRAPLATSPAIADDDLAAVSHVLGYDNWARWKSIRHAAGRSEAESAASPQDSYPITPPAVFGAIYHAVESVPPHKMVPSQQRCPEYVEHHTYRYQNAANMYGTYPQRAAHKEPESPIMDHLPFPEECTSPHSYTPASTSSVQSPAHATHFGTPFTTPPRDRRSQAMSSGITSPTTASTASAYSPKVEVDYPMPTPWSSSPSPSCKSPKHRLLPHSRKHYLIWPRESKSRSSSPRVSPRASPAPSKRGGKKPSLACLFCRGRKIACGPPPPGSDEKTCNQCFRRQLDCQYPVESRRGLRKRKSSKINTAGPKVPIKTPRRR